MLFKSNRMWNFVFVVLYFCFLLRLKDGHFHFFLSFLSSWKLVMQTRGRMGEFGTVLSVVSKQKDLLLTASDSLTNKISLSSFSSLFIVAFAHTASNIFLYICCDHFKSFIHVSWNEWMSVPNKWLVTCIILLTGSLSRK